MAPPSNCNNLLARIIVIFAILLTIIGIILYSYDLYRHGKQPHLIGWFSSAGFVLLTFAISIRLIYLHLSHWYFPSVQKWLVRIIWMIPIYSIESWLALRFRSEAIYIETIRESYEAYAIFSFLYFLIALLGEEAALISNLKHKSQGRGEHCFPLNLFIKPWIMGPEFLHHCKFGVLQYVLFRNLMALVTFILQIFDLYGRGQFRFDRGYLYICFISNASQIWALYCLIKFYVVTAEELKPWNPFGKFLCVKFVVFFTWWQSILVSIGANSINVDDSASWTRDEKIGGFEDYLICIEMFFASIAFSISFTYNDYLPKHKDDEERQQENRPFLSALLQSSLPDEIFVDIRRLSKGQELSEKSYAIAMNKSSDILKQPSTHNDVTNFHKEKELLVEKYNTVGLNKSNDGVKQPTLHNTKQSSIHNDDTFFHNEKEISPQEKHNTVVVLNKSNDIVKLTPLHREDSFSYKEKQSLVDDP